MGEHAREGGKGDENTHKKSAREMGGGQGEGTDAEKLMQGTDANKGTKCT